MLVTRSLLIFLSRESKRNGAKCDLGGARSKKKGAMSEPFFSEGEATQQTFSEAEVRVVADSLSRQIRREKSQNTLNSRELFHNSKQHSMQRGNDSKFRTILSTSSLHDSC